MKTVLYYPCIYNSRTGKISTKIRNNPMSKEMAENIIKSEHWSKWLRLEAIPQPITHPYFQSR